MSYPRAATGILTALLALGFAAPSRSDVRMYTGSLVIHAFGDDAISGSLPPYSSFPYIGIPLKGQCNTRPYHAPETLTFPTMTMSPATRTVMFTIPAYGGQVPVDLNGDTVPDGPAGCTSVSQGDPLTASGLIHTDGALSTSRTTMDPRGFTVPAFALNKVKTGASFNVYSIPLWDVHFADLHNHTGVFAKNGGDGSFAVTHSAKPKRKAVQTAGKNKFGGVMRLLGSYGDSQGYFNPYDAITTVFKYDWLLENLGDGGQATSGGVVTAGYAKSGFNYYYTRSFGSRGTSTVHVEAFKWTTGTVTVTALGGAFPTILQRQGYDSRTAMGSGAVQLVSPMLTRWVNTGEASTASIGILKLIFVPEPHSRTMLLAGASMLGLLYRVCLRARRE
jgi:hypothetical protein